MTYLIRFVLSDDFLELSGNCPEQLRLYGSSEGGVGSLWVWELEGC
jgi:hypothetical protein